MESLPRRHRETGKSADDNPMAQGLLKASIHRTQRLLRSFNELEREVYGISLESNIPASHSKIDADPHWLSIDVFGDEWWEPCKKGTRKGTKSASPGDFYD